MSPVSGPLETLLAVQERDLALDRLGHRRAALPERRELARVRAALAALEERERAVDGARGELVGRQRRLESDVESMGRRVRDIEGRLYGGTVSASRELTAMAEEVESLRRRQSGHEDEILALMEQVEPLDAELGALVDRQAELEAEAASIGAAIADAEAAIAAEEAVEREAREALAAQLPPALSGQYERLRARLGGIGAARLVNGSCTGCHLALPAAELERLRHLDSGAFATCEQCGRILVH